MEKLLTLFLIPFLCLGCAKSKSDSPKMTISGIYLNGDEEDINYADQLDNLPSLQLADKVDIIFDLEGNGNDLYSFIVRNENTAIKTVLSIEDAEVSSDLSDLRNGELVFVDGISETSLTVQVEVIAPITAEQLLSFFLFSKSPDTTGATEELIFNPNPDQE